jgi:GMP synthase (glutamine-hydrolysing)
MTKVVAIQHVPCETVGRIGDALTAVGITIEQVRTFEGQPVPKAMEGIGGLVIMGGPMGVYEQDRYPFLRQEIRLIEQVLQKDKPVLGVCLGSQLLASALGAKVTKGKAREIGWHPVTLTPVGTSDPLWIGLEPSFTAYHWHGDVFDPPPDAVSLASSDLTRCQAFRYGRHAYGFLFHLEVTEGMIENMVKTFQEELRESNTNGRRIVERARNYLPALQRIGRTVFERWAGLIQS